MDEADLKLDGNAAAGVLREIFAYEMTAALGTCASCGNVEAIGGVSVYLHAPGIVLRCPKCDQALMRIVQAPGRCWISLTGIRCLELSLPGER